jgi:hypothetical protein
MKATIYWAMQHSRRAMHELHFRATCCWLRQQVEFLEWRLKLEAKVPSAPSNSAPTPVGEGSRYAVHSLY